jgi:3-oxoacyl-[acyl-carrier protein] reductase
MMEVGSVALVTGASGEIGRAIALELSKRFDVVVLHYRSNEAAARALGEDIARGGGRAELVCGELEKSASADAMVAQVQERWGRVDALVNNAGASFHGLITDTSDEELEWVLAVNLKSAFYVCRSVLPSMLSARRGTIVNVSSVAASRPTRGNAAYAVAKAGLEGLTRALAAEAGERGVRVNAVAPGIIQSRMTRQLVERSGNALLSGVTLRRLGCPQDVASAVAFLSSPESAFITGDVLCVDGGRCHMSLV